MRFGLLTGRQEGVTQGFLANGGHSVLRLRRTVRTWVIAESQGNGGFSLADSQSSRANFDEATCETSWHVLDSSVEDLLRSLP
jgi:hypothetical protein